MGIAIDSSQFEIEPSALGATMLPRKLEYLSLNTFATQTSIPANSR
jgi:hypothetical protein